MFLRCDCQMILSSHPPCPIRIISASCAPRCGRQACAGETSKLQPPSPAPDFGRWIAHFSAECKQRFFIRADLSARHSDFS